MTPPRAAGTPVVYRCATCQKRVAVIQHPTGGAQIIRACPHEGSGVTADLTATVYSESRLNG